MHPAVESAALALGLDAATAQVTLALAQHGIASVLLKGPSTALRLYTEDPSSRTYVDIDLLVDPGQFEAAERILEQLGYSCPIDGVSPSERLWLMETPWTRPGSPPVSVDLHRGFHGVRDWAGWWRMMDEYTEIRRVGGADVRVPDDAGCALVVVLHQAAAGHDAKSSEDLNRALARFDREIWTSAAERAALVGVISAFTVGLSHHESGRGLIRTLGLSLNMSLEAAAQAAASGPGSAQDVRAWLLVQRMSRGRTWRERGRALWDLAFPSANMVRFSRPLARRGGLALGLVRLSRPLELVYSAPGVFLRIWRGHRRSRLSRRVE